MLRNSFFAVAAILVLGCATAPDRETDSGAKLKTCPKSECTFLPSAPPSMLCPDGSTAGPTEECHRQSDGSCRPVVRACPQK